MRLILQTPGEDSLQLVNPVTNSQSSLANTETPILLLFADDASSMLLIRDSGERRFWQWMPIDGSQVTIVREVASTTWPVAIEWFYNKVRFVEGDKSGQYILDVVTGSTQILELPEIPDHVRRTPVVRNRSGDSMAFWVWVEGTRTLRILEIETGHQVDIETGLSYIKWSQEDEFIALRRDDYALDLDVVDVFDAGDGSLAHSILPPADFSYVHVGYLTWAPEDRFLAVDYGNVDHTQSAVHFFDLNEETWIGNCFQIERSLQRSYFSFTPVFSWTPDGRFLWWLEQTGAGDDTYDLVVADVETGAFGTVATGIGRNSGIGFVES
ncbi:MAG: hypothetical protein K8S97_01380 [Anaerolineae bacterium]|nr:hypothetical protein [Anaerolineae bacterium]